MIIMDAFSKISHDLQEKPYGNWKISVGKNKTYVLRFPSKQEEEES